MPDEPTEKKPETPTQQTLPGTGDAAAKAEADRLRAENATLKAERDKAVRDAKAKKAAQDDTLKAELDKRNDELAAREKELEEMRTAHKARIEASIAKLPKEQQEELALVKDDLPIAKLEALVEKRLSALTKPTDDKKPDDTTTTTKPPAPPAPGIKGNQAPKGHHEVHPETAGVLKSVNAKANTFEMAKGLGVDSTGKFGWGRTDDEDESKTNFINLLDSIKAIPEGGVSDDEMYSRVLKK